MTRKVTKQSNKNQQQQQQQQQSLFPLSGVGYMNPRTPLRSGLFQSFPRSSSTPSALNLCPVVTSLNWSVSMPSLHMSNPLIPNLILSRQPTPPTKHPHLRYTHFVYVLMLHRPTLCAIQHRRPYCCPIKFSFEL
ncbi:hypothetical protein DVH24_010965 [Malus domestica]|uniref:Uncharacterized protein n=1 Tax=Malus domestica TaxID=3750 RepID=A0A498JT79_MALDO|nr:hypothetical protein DVH24_010965 [Malus domestica]